VDEAITRTAGSLARQHRRACSVDDADYLIAATAIILDAGVADHHVRPFPNARGSQPCI